MEPYRPFVDKMVCELKNEMDIDEGLTRQIKARLLGLPIVDVVINGCRSPLMNAVHQTTSSLVKCFNGESRKIIYPDL